MYPLCINALGMRPAHRLDFDEDSTNTGVLDKGVLDAAGIITQNVTKGAAGIFLRKSYTFTTSPYSYVRIPGANTHNFDSSAFSISMWVKMNAISSVNNLLWKRGGASSPILFIRYLSTGNLVFGFDLLGDDLTAAASLPTGEWHNITFVYTKQSGVNRFVYLDGILKGSDDAGTTGLVGVNGADLYLGGEDIGSSSDVNMAGVKVYDYALDLVEVRNIFMTDAVTNIATIDNTVLYSTLNSLADAQAPKIGPNGVQYNTPTFAAAVFGNGLYSDAEEGIDFDHSILDNYKGTIELWWIPIYDDATVKALCSIIDSVNNSSRFFCYYSKGNGIYAYHSWTTPSILFAPLSCVGGQAYHIAICWDEDGIDGTTDTMRLYIDNVLRDSHDTTGIPDGGHPHDASLRLGAWVDNASRYGDATYDNVKVYDYAKTDFSDRFVEFGVSTYTSKLKTVSHYIVLFNTLGSTSEVGTSIVGPDGTENGVLISYGAGKFGNGAETTAGGTSYLDFGLLDNVIPRQEPFSFDFWWKPNSTAINQAAWFVGFGRDGDADFVCALQWLGTGAGEPDQFEFYWYTGSTTYTEKFQQSSLGYPIPVSGTNMHIAVALDHVNGKCYLFVNGVQYEPSTASAGLVPGLTVNTNAATTIKLWHNQQGATSGGIIDTLRVHKGLKNYYGDRESEYPVSLKEVVI